MSEQKSAFLPLAATYTTRGSLHQLFARREELLVEIILIRADALQVPTPGTSLCRSCVKSDSAVLPPTLS